MTSSWDRFEPDEATVRDSLNLEPEIAKWSQIALEAAQRLSNLTGKQITIAGLENDDGEYTRAALPKEWASQLRISPRTLFRRVEQGKVRVRKVGKQWRLHIADTVAMGVNRALL
jgi:hypothetical protein